MEKKQLVQVLWTGGMDSTLIMIQLSMQNVRLLPVYIIKANARITESIELETMNKIYEMLKKDSRTKAELLPIRIVADSPELVPQIAKTFEHEYYKRVRYKETLVTLRRAQKKVLDLQANKAPGLGGWKSNIIRLAEQYAAISSYARADQTIVELGVHGEESFFQLPIPYRVEVKQQGEITRYMLTKDGTDPDIYELFKNISFTIFPLNKIGVYNRYAELGYEEIRGMLWHCYAPINGKPCGKCTTCVPYIREGMYDMFDRAALIRYIQFCDRERAAIDQQYQEIIKSKMQ